MWLRASAGFFAIFFTSARVLFADGFLRFETLNEAVDAPVSAADSVGPGSCARAALVLHEGRRETLLRPQTMFRREAAFLMRYVMPVVVRVPGYEPGDEVEISMRVLIGEITFAESSPFTVRLGTKEEPGLLIGLRGFNGPIVGSSYYFVDPEFAAAITRNGSTDGLNIGGLKYLGDGRIFVAGNFTEVNGEPWPGIVLLSTNGAIDWSFTNSFGPADEVTCLDLLPDAKLVLGGRFEVNGERTSMIRLDGTGRRELSFGIPGEVTAVTVLSQTNWIAIGMGTNEAEVRIVDFDGVAVPGFPTFRFRNPERNARIQGFAEDGTNLWVGGNFTEVNGRAASMLARVLRGGTIETTNGVPLIEGGTVRSLRGFEGGIGVAGDFTSVDHQECQGYFGYFRNSVSLLPPWFGEGIQLTLLEAGVAVADGTGETELAELWLPWFVTRVSGTIQRAIRRKNPPANAWGEVVMAGDFAEIPEYIRREKHLGIGRFLGYISVPTGLLNPPEVYENGTIFIAQRYFGGSALEYSDDLTNWFPLPECFSDRTGPRARFYRVKK